MPGTVRRRMIKGALELLSRKGLQCTSFAEVTEATHTPRGSIYHHFPGGKAEMVKEALRANVEEFCEAVKSLNHDSPEDFTEAYLTRLRDYIQETNFEAGSAATAVTVAAESEAQLAQASEVFAGFESALRQGLIASGAKEDAAKDFATLVLVASGGANTVARAGKSLREYDTVKRLLIQEAQALPRA